MADPVAVVQPDVVVNPYSKPACQRIVSIDLLRGLDVLLMLFVNEMAGVTNTPGFLRHTPSVTEGITITDIVFPAFLFIVGMAIPVAIGGRLRRSESRGSVWRHVLARTAALLVMGVLMVAPEQASRAGLLSPHLWNVLVTVAVLLAWQQPTAGGKPEWARGTRIAGCVLLVVLILLFRSEHAAGLVQIRPSWWGILGLIGWAYLVGSALYLLLGERPAALTAATALLYCFYFAEASGNLPWLAPIRHNIVSTGAALGSHGAIVVSGTLLTLLIRRRQLEPKRLIAEALGFAAALAMAGMLLHTLHADPLFWYHKNRATVPWCLLSSAWTTLAWVALYWIVDVKGWRRWPSFVHLCGANPLLIYLLTPGILSLFALTPHAFGGKDFYTALGATLVIGTVRSLVFIGLVVASVAGLRRVGLHVRI